MNTRHELPNFVSANPVTVHRDESVEKALQLIDRTEIGSLLVVDQDERLVGILTGKDLVLKVLAKKRDIVTTRVEEVMTANPSTLRIDHAIDLNEVAKALGRSRVRRLPVVDENKHPVGIVSLDDVLVEAGEIFTSLRAAVSSDVTMGRMRASKISPPNSRL